MDNGRTTPQKAYHSNLDEWLLWQASLQIGKVETSKPARTEDGNS